MSDILERIKCGIGRIPPKHVENKIVRDLQWAVDEIERLHDDLQNARNAIKLLIGRTTDTPWSEVSDADVDGNIQFIREQAAAESAVPETIGEAVK